MVTPITTTTTVRPISTVVLNISEFANSLRHTGPQHRCAVQRNLTWNSVRVDQDHGPQSFARSWLHGSGGQFLRPLRRSLQDQGKVSESRHVKIFNEFATASRPFENWPKCQTTYRLCQTASRKYNDARFLQ